MTSVTKNNPPIEPLAAETEMRRETDQAESCDSSKDESILIISSSVQELKFYEVKPAADNENPTEIKANEAAAEPAVKAGADEGSTTEIKAKEAVAEPEAKTPPDGENAEISGRETVGGAQPKLGKTRSAEKPETNQTEELKDAENATERSLEILKQQLTKLDDNIRRDKNKSTAEAEAAPYSHDDVIDLNEDTDDDFDPSLLCPEVSMDVDEEAVIAGGGDLKSPVDDNAASINEYLDEALCVLTKEENDLKQHIFGPNNPVQFTRLHCTACNMHLGSALDNQSNRLVHPLLRVLICKTCHHFYSSGDFEKDEDGSELYCRWCGQGGQVLCCSKCEYVFCCKCIRTNIGRKKVAELKESDNWLCFRCAPDQLTSHRVTCAAFFDYVRRQMASVADDDDAEWTTDYSMCCNWKKRKAAAAIPLSRTDPDYEPKEVEEDEEEEREKRGPFKMPKVYKIEAARPIAPVGAPPYGEAGPPPPHGVVNPLAAPPAHGVVNPLAAPPAHGVFTQQQQQLQHIIIPNSILKALTTNAPGMAGHLPPLTPMTQQAKAMPKQGAQKRTLGINHEWFDKTVRATNTINSQLSVSMAHLSKLKAQAASLENLASIHNKLQETLCSSINSLIQVRRNLKQEFLNNVKVIQYGPKANPKPTRMVSEDDDVIMVEPPPLMPNPANQQRLVNPAALQANGGIGFIKVKSMSDLRGVAAKKIVKKPVKHRVQNLAYTNGPKLKAVNGVAVPNINNFMRVVQVAGKVGCANGVPAIAQAQAQVSPSTSKAKVDAMPVVKSTNLVKGDSGNRLVYNVKGAPSAIVRKMMSAHVKLERMEHLFKKKKIKDCSLV